jgi:glycerophosphoryl diester phosphodiesterase
MLYQWESVMRGSWIVLVILLVGCRKKQDYSTVQVVGHAGMGLKIENSVYHDNSKEAVDFALGIEGCDGVEVDVQIAKDGGLWLYHNNELESNTTGNSCVPELNSSELSELHYSTLAKEKLVRLNDLDPTKLKNKTLFLDIRHLNACSGQFVLKENFLNALSNSDLINDPSIETWCILANPEWIDDFHGAGLKVLFSASGHSNFLSFINDYPELDGLVVKNSETTQQDVDQLHSLGKKVFIFEIRSPKGIRSALKKFPDGVITDDIRTTLIEKY